jgi:hypothetical protein
VAELPGFDEPIIVYEDMNRERFSGPSSLFTEVPRETPLKKSFIKTERPDAAIPTNEATPRRKNQSRKSAK